MQLVGAAVLPGALERPWQQRVRERLARDPLGVERVGLPALARPVRPRRAVRAHVAHVIAAADQEDRGVPAPARGALDPPACDLTELPRPRLERAMPVPGHPEVLRWRGSRRADRRPSPSTSACAGRPRRRCPRDRASSARCDGPGPPSRCWPSAQPSAGTVMADPVDNVPVGIGAPRKGERSYQVRPAPRRHGPRSTLRHAGHHHRGPDTIWGRGRDSPSLCKLGLPPAQIPACASNALGSWLGFWRRSARRARDA